MKNLLFILLPPATKLAEFDGAVQELLAPHRLDHSLDEYQPNWKYDYLCSFESTLNCDETDAELPESIRAEWQGYFSKVHRLRPDCHASAIITPDGAWHEIFDFGWKMSEDAEDAESNAKAEEQWRAHFLNVLNQYRDCWVFETWAHS